MNITRKAKYLVRIGKRLKINKLYCEITKDLGIFVTARIGNKEEAQRRNIGHQFSEKKIELLVTFPSKLVTVGDQSDKQGILSREVRYSSGSWLLYIGQGQMGSPLVFTELVCPEP